MPEFKYKARNSRGASVRGAISSDSEKKAINALHSKGFSSIKLLSNATTSIKSNNKGISKYIFKDSDGNIQISLGPSYPTSKELALFTKQFSLMLENGVNIISALKLLERSQKKQTFAAIINEVSGKIERGAELNEALEPFPQVFDTLYIAMIRAGERSGKLDVILKQLVMYIEKTAKIKSQVKSAMMYPSIIVIVSILVVTLLLVFVVPTLAENFAESGQSLPELTLLVLDTSNALRSNWDIILATLVSVIVGGKYWKETDSGRNFFDTYVLRMPIIGDVMRKIAVGRFCSTMSTMLSSGVAIIDSLKICAAASGNSVVESFVLSVKEEIEKGGSFHAPLERSPLFPSIVTSMVEVGESTGKLDETLKKITEIYEDEVDLAIETMTSLIEPIMIVVIGAIVGVIVIAMYLPMFDMANTVGA